MMDGNCGGGVGIGCDEHDLGPFPDVLEALLFCGRSPLGIEKRVEEVEPSSTVECDHAL